MESNDSYNLLGPRSHNNLPYNKTLTFLDTIDSTCSLLTAGFLTPPPPPPSQAPQDVACAEQSSPSAEALSAPVQRSTWHLFSARRTGTCSVPWTKRLRSAPHVAPVQCLNWHPTLLSLPAPPPACAGPMTLVTPAAPCGRAMSPHQAAVYFAFSLSASLSLSLSVSCSLSNQILSFLSFLSLPTFAHPFLAHSITLSMSFDC